CSWVAAIVVECVVQAEEEESAAMGAGDGLGDSGERGVDGALVGEAGGQDFDLTRLALVETGDKGAWLRQTLVWLRGANRVGSRFDGCRLGNLCRSWGK